MIDWGLTAAVVAQITGGVTTTLVAVTGTAAFLYRKRQRVRELRWLIRVKVNSVEVNDRGHYFTEPITAESLMAHVRDPDKLEALLSHASGWVENVQEIHQMAEEYYFWGRLFRLGRRPETL